jgi:transketolase
MPRRASGAGRRVRAPDARRLPRPAGRTPPRDRATGRKKAETVATRKASQQALEAYAKLLPELLGGSADLTGSNLTDWSGQQPAARPRAGTGNHLSLRRARVRHGRDHERPRAARRLPPLRRHLPHLQRLLAQRAAHGRADEAAGGHVFTHDSIGLGEDGPTHQAVEHAVEPAPDPGLDVWRPADAVETAVAWRGASSARRPHRAAAARARACRTPATAASAPMPSRAAATCCASRPTSRWC